ncbi:MAG: hypothetical protein DLM59_19960 [Pseudonocardiales bacterium]|nr:MAG: hypothetical protein DLM59_19960 [Pseudonocardiales bacterium]
MRGRLVAAGSALCLAVLASVAAPGTASAAVSPVTSRASVSGAGAQANGQSGSVAISADGRYLAFASAASNLVPGDTNDASDVFVRDRRTGSTSRVSVADSGAQAACCRGSDAPAISADGRYVAFASGAPDLVSGDASNGVEGIDVFVRDRHSGTTTRVDVSGLGAQAEAGSRSTAPAISADGRYVAFQSDATNLVPGAGGGGVFMHDMWIGSTRRISVSGTGQPANGPAGSPSISADGRYVAFESPASNLVPGDTNGASDVFLRDVQAGITQRVSVSGSGAQGDGASFHPSIDGPGWLVAFESDAANLVPGDTNDNVDVFLRDWQGELTRRISVSGTGAQASGGAPAISTDGAFVAFTSGSANLVPGDTNDDHDVFVRDWISGTTRRASVSGTGGQGNGLSYAVTLSAGGHAVGFLSWATNLVPADTNGALDVFLRST